MIKKMLNFTILLILFFCLTLKVNAATTPYWGYDVQHFNNGWFYDCITSSSCSSAITTVPQWGFNEDITHQYPGFKSSSFTTVADSYGGMFIFNINELLIQDYLYSMRFYICNTTNSNRPDYISAVSGNTNVDLYNFKYPVELYNGPFHIADNSLPYPLAGNDSGGATATNGTCYNITTVFSVEVQSTKYGIQFTTPTTTSASWWAIGYDLYNIGSTSGLSSSQVTSIVNKATSKLATSSDIAEIDTALNEVKTELNNVSNSVDNLNDSINNSNSSEATDNAGDFFSGFQTDTFGLTSVITAPLTLIGSITSSSCSSLALEIPFVNKTLNLPCLTTIYENFFGPFLTVYQTITFGIVAYWVCIRIFALVKDFKNPDHDEIEVLDL